MTESDNLSDAERARIRNSLRAYMIEHPARAPFMQRLLDWADVQSGYTQIFFSSIYVRSSAAALLVLIVIGSGTSYAAQSALPGDALYPIKVGVNEKVELALATTPQAHAQLDAEFAQRRIQEAETLAMAGKLSPAVSQVLGSRLDLSTADFDAQVATLATSSDMAAANVQADFETDLAAQSQVLAAISTAIPNAGPAMQPLQAKIHGHLKAAQVVSNRFDQSIATSSSDAELSQTAQDTAQNALEASQELQDLMPIVQNSLGATSSVLLKNKAQGIQDSLTAGQDHMHKGNYSEALGSFQDAIRSAQQTRAAVAASLQFKKMLQLAGRHVAEKGTDLNATDVAITLMSATSTISASSTDSDQ